MAFEGAGKVAGLEIWRIEVIYILQMKGRWKSKINVRYRFMYSQKRNCVALLFPKQNFNVLSPHFHIHVSVSDSYSQDGSAYFAAAKWADRYMNERIGNEAAQFHFIFSTVHCNKKEQNFFNYFCFRTESRKKFIDPISYMYKNTN